jgi:DNA-binding GntR family transcriptional regulator
MSESGSRVEKSYKRLRVEILGGQRAPGSRLATAHLAAEHKVSLGVIREALVRLAAEGLVESQAQLGFRVVSLHIDDLRHLTEARCAIESMVVSAAIQNTDVGWESGVLAAHHRLVRTPELAGDESGRQLSDAWVEAHSEFHSALLSGCPNPRLVSVAQSLRDSAELYRRWSVPLSDDERDVTGEHRALLDAVLDRNVDAAVAALTDHINETSRRLLAHETDGAHEPAN